MPHRSQRAGSILQVHDVVVRLWELAHTPRWKKILRYFASSVLTTGVSFVVLTLLFGVFRVWSEVPSTLAANLTATVPSYFLNRNWAWGKSGPSHVWREMVPFWITAVVGIALSAGSAQLARNVTDDHHLHHLLATVTVDGANVATFVVLWVVKLLIFNRLFRTTPVADRHDGLVEAA